MTEEERKDFMEAMRITEETMAELEPLFESKRCPHCGSNQIEVEAEADYQDAYRGMAKHSPYHIMTKYRTRICHYTLKCFNCNRSLVNWSTRDELPYEPSDFQKFLDARGLGHLTDV